MSVNSDQFKFLSLLSALHGRLALCQSVASRVLGLQADACEGVVSLRIAVAPRSMASSMPVGCRRYNQACISKAASLKSD